MARRKSPTLTEAELKLMDIIWHQGQVTVSDVVAALPKDEKLAYSTVLTTLRILEQKGYLRHHKEGRAFVYAPLVDKKGARKNVVRYVMSRFFDNSAELLVLNLLENGDIDAAELERLKRQIEED